MVSTRRKQLQAREYQVGDKVEIVRAAGGVDVGTLVSKNKVTSTSPRGSPVDHWMVSVTATALADSSPSTSTTTDPTATAATVLTFEEDISERMLGRILSDTTAQVSGSSSDASVAAATSVPAAAQSPFVKPLSTTKAKTSPAAFAEVAVIPITTMKQQQQQQNSAAVHGKKRPAAAAAAPLAKKKLKAAAAAAKHATTAAAAHTTTRQQRSTPPPLSRSHTRSTAGDAQLLSGVTHHHGNATAAATSAAASNSNNNSAAKKNRLKAATTTTASSSDRGILTTRNGLPVTKVPMNTGTLYIYAGTRQAEFVRTK